jgi:peptide subunit release factor 1 (eRF1)
MTSPDRAFLTIYISGKASLKSFEKWVKKTMVLVKSNKDELEYFEENMKLVEKYFDKNPLKSGGLCIFACWATNYFEVIPITVPIPDIFWVDSSPYIRPLAELQDEYENYLVVVADNKSAKIFLVTASTPEDEFKVKGNIKNHVRKGGWSQQRYERRRDKQLLLYAKEIADKLVEYNNSEKFRRILLVGSKETLIEIEKVLPPQILKKVVGDKAIDLSKGETFINQEIFDLFVHEERNSEMELWSKIKNEYMKGGLGIIGYEAILDAAKLGKIEKMIIIRDLKMKGFRCRDCDILMYDEVDVCAGCGSGSLFEVDLVEEMIELVKLSSGETDFIDSISELDELGGIAALIRY